MMSSGAWGGQERPMTTTPPGPDFHQFLDINEIAGMDDAMQFDFHGFQDSGPNHHMLSSHQRQTADTLMGNTDHQQAVMSGPDGHAILSALPAASMSSVAQAAHAPAVPAHMMEHRSASDEAIQLIDAQIHYLQQQKFHQRQQQMREQQAFFSPTGGPQQQQTMASTPHSIEMTPGSGQFYPTPDHMSSSRSAFERTYHQRLTEQQDMAFTPLVSPAVTPLTPLDAHFNIDSAFVVPAAYFSPLTSPALRAQNDHSSLYDYSSGHSHNSPSEPKLDSSTIATVTSAATTSAMTTTTTTTLTSSSSSSLTSSSSSNFHSASNLDNVKRHSRKNTATKIRTKPSVKSSPICKPQRRKTGPSPAIVSQVLSEVDAGRMRALDPDALALPASSSEASDESASVSPDACTDMPPPPIPARASNSISPYIRPQVANQPQGAPVVAAEINQLHPATPASLMKLPASKAGTSNAKPAATKITRPEPLVAVDVIESLELPEAVSHRDPPSVPPINTKLISASPRIEPRSAPASASVFPSSQPIMPSSARGPGPSPSTQSPRLQPGPSSAFPLSSTPTSSLSVPISPAPSGVRRTPHLAPRHSRKRSSGSVHISPALLPKISPNIKPLIPGAAGMSVEDQASRLLITKSNYQNILEGNQVPGVSYPSELSTNITSKRTSHKIAEQGRRNRINSALQIMAGLLPESKNSKDAGVGGHGGGGGGVAGAGGGGGGGGGGGKMALSLSGDDSGDKKDGGKQANASNSKASVVENAIVHMQRLEKENGDLRQELKALKEQLGKLQGRSDGS